MAFGSGKPLTLRLGVDFLDERFVYNRYSIRGYSDPNVPGEIPLASGPASVNVLILVTVEVVPHVAVAVAEAGITIARQRLNKTSNVFSGYLLKPASLISFTKLSSIYCNAFSGVNSPRIAACTPYSSISFNLEEI
jgi:hypothetical protein